MMMIFSILSIFKNVKFFSGSRGSHGPDLPLPCGRKFLFHSQDDQILVKTGNRDPHYDEIKLILAR